MGWQGFESFAATVAAEKKPKETHFHKHGHPKKTWVVHEPKDIDCYFDDQEDNPKYDRGHSVQRKCFLQVSPVSIVILQNGCDHCDERDAHDPCDIDLEADAKAREVFFGNELLETEEKNALDLRLAHNF